MKLRRSISGVVIAAIVVLVILLAAVAAYAFFSISSLQSQNSSLQREAAVSEVTQLAYQHWAAIGEANLTATMSEYSSSAQLWWYVRNSPLNTVSSAYTGSNISETWSKFFKVGPTYWAVYNFSVTIQSSTSAKVTADLWYVIGNGNSTRTLYLPYELDYSYQNGHWMLVGDWWGLPNHYGYSMPGVVSPS
jgi:hypothetical protein